MAKTTPGEFVNQVRREVSKVTWPTRKETLMTAAMVLLMVVLAAVFFTIVDMFLALGVRTIFGIGG